MSFLEFGGQRHALPVGESVLGSDASAIVPLEGDDVLPQHAVMQVDPDGQVTIRKAQESAEVMVNGVWLGANPIPLLHGDKVTIGGQELSFIDERKSGSTLPLRFTTSVSTIRLINACSNRLVSCT